MLIAASLYEPLRAALATIGDTTPVSGVHPLGGGCINNALRLTTGVGVYFLKWHPHSPAGMFLAEAHGLALLRETGSVRVPAVYAVADANGAQPGFLLLEWLEEAGNRGDQALLGAQLAALHAASAPTYGLDHDNYIGSTPQPNGYADDWVSFFRERRLRHQVDLAARSGLLSLARRRGLERLMDRLDSWLGGVTRRPSLIHGDLWGGNLHPCAEGIALIDPAVSYSDREAEIAYTALFGGFSTRFYQGYNEAWPLEPGFADRRDLYNLYHLLNHLHIFGSGYASAVDEVLLHYGRG